MSKTLKCNSLWSMISHRPQHQYIFLRASKVLNDNCFEKGGGYSHPCNKTCFGVNGVSSIQLFPQTCKQQPAACSPQSFKWIWTQNKNACIATPSPPLSVNPPSLFRPWQYCSSPNLVAKTGWRLLCNAIAGTCPVRWQEVLLGQHLGTLPKLES